MDLPNITNIKNYLLNLLPSFLGSLLIFILFYSVANIVFNYFDKSTKPIIIYQEINQEVRQEVDPSTRTHLAYYQIKTLLYYTILTIGFIYAISNMGYFPTTLLTIFGVLTLAIGLSLKDLFSSLASGIYLSLVELYEIGDYIKITYIPTKNSDDGYVVDFNLFYTTLKSNDGTLIKIPNNKIQSNTIINNI
jgi:small-conductance mechanosensitive channel